MVNQIWTRLKPETTITLAVHTKLAVSIHAYIF